MNVKQVLLNCGINAFGAELLAESLLRHPAPIPLRFFLPVHRKDCPGFVGVEFRMVPERDLSAVEYHGDFI